MTSPRIDHTNDFHEALTKVHDIAKNGTRNAAAWNEVLETVDTALERARSRELAAQRAREFAKNIE